MSSSSLMPKTGLEPVRICGSQDFKSCASANSATSATYMAPRVGLEPTTYRLTAGCSTIELPRNNSQANSQIFLLLLSQKFGIYCG